MAIANLIISFGLNISKKNTYFINYCFSGSLIIISYKFILRLLYPDVEIITLVPGHSVLTITRNSNGHNLTLSVM